MHFQYDNWLLILSLVASSIGALITFSFVDYLYTSAQQFKRRLLPTFSLVVGACLWCNHVLLSYAFKLDLGETRNIFPSMTALALVFAVVTAFVILYSASKREIKFKSTLGIGTVAAFSTLAMYFFDSASIHGIENVHPELHSTEISMFFNIISIACLTYLLSWLKNYSGKNLIPIKLLSALIISINIVAVHFTLDRAFAHGERITTEAIQMQLMEVVIALTFLSVVLILFALILFFEKHGITIFKFNFLNRSRDSEFVTESTEDSLTKLPNRRAFQLHLDGAAKRSNRTGSTFALAYIDLDHFKPVNDEFGHHIGDILLSKVAERLNLAVRGCDYVARIGGDEFVAIFEEIKSNEDITPIAERIVNSIKETFSISQYNIEISCSIGIAIYPKDGDLEKLMVCADSAMYKAKEGGKNQYKFYDTEIEFASEEMLGLQSDLCLAIERNEFSVSYQPKIDCKTNAPIGAEALIRWEHPTKGELQPKAFLQAAERFGLINEINSWVVDECCRTIARAKQAGIQLNISVNLSSNQFRNPNLVKDILKSLKYYNLDASSLSFEIKETIAVNNQVLFKQILERFNEAGLKLVLDDFGLHPISLAYLQDLKVSEIKLDKTFISGVTQDKNSKALIDAVIKLAHALNLRVVAEGVETEALRDMVVELGCDYMQGYLFSIPVTADNLFQLYNHLLSRQTKLAFEAHDLLASDYQLQRAL